MIRITEDNDEREHSYLVYGEVFSNLVEDAYRNYFKEFSRRFTRKAAKELNYSALALHHKDADTHNNELSNVYLMTNSAHSRLHNLIKNKKALRTEFPDKDLENCRKELLNDPEVISNFDEFWKIIEKYIITKSDIENITKMEDKF